MLGLDHVQLQIFLTCFQSTNASFLSGSLYSANDPLWLTNGSPNHLLHVLAKILDTFAETPSAVSYQER
jgi:hypothetical protein